MCTCPVQEHAENAMEVFDSAVQNTLPAADEAEEPCEVIEAAIAKAREEVWEDLYKVLDLVEAKVHAQAKAEKAKRLEAEKQQLEQQMHQEQELHKLKQALLKGYKAKMQDKQAAFTSADEAEQEHKVCVWLIFPCFCSLFHSGHSWTVSQLTWSPLGVR